VSDVSDPDYVAERGIQRKFDRKEELAVLRGFMSNPVARKLMYRWIRDCYLDTSCFTGNSKTFFNEGKREVALNIVRDLEESCPELYSEMKMEHKKRNN